MTIAIDIEWGRDPAGYDLVAAPPPNPRRFSMPVVVFRQSPERLAPDRRLQALEAGLDTGATAGGELIVARSGGLVRERPFAKPFQVFRVFAGRARSKEGLMDFINQFGPLTEMAHSEPGEPVQIGLSDAAIMRHFLSCDDNQRARFLSMMTDDGFFLGRPSICLSVDAETTKLQTVYKAASLREALWLQFGQELSTGHTIRECVYCGGLFEVGLGTNRRADAKFCSDEHRIAYNSEKRTKR